MTPEQERKLHKLVGAVADQYGCLTEDGVVELALVSNELMWALARLSDYQRRLRSEDMS